MTTPYKLLVHKKDPWTVKAKKKVARWLWNDLTKRQDLPEPAEGYPGADPSPKKLLKKLDMRRPIKEVIENAEEET